MYDVCMYLFINLQLGNLVSWRTGIVIDKTSRAQNSYIKTQGQSFEIFLN